MVISILVDLGLNTAKYMRQSTYRQRTWAYNVTGHKSPKYPSLPRGLDHAIESILQNSTNLIGLKEYWDYHGWTE